LLVPPGRVGPLEIHSHATAFSPSDGKGAVYHLKKEDLCFFLLYFDKTPKKLELLNVSWGKISGLFNVLKLLIPLNTQLTIYCFIYSFLVFISTNKHCCL
jgi:hypothetical protein